MNLKHDISMIKNSDDGLKKKHNQSQPVTGRESLCNYSEQSAYRIVVVVIIVIVFRDYYQSLRAESNVQSKDISLHDPFICESLDH